jgi:hypothetical protein
MSEEKIPSIDDFKFAVTIFDPAEYSYGSFNSYRDETFTCQNLRELKAKLENVSTGSECGSLFVLHEEKPYNAVVFTSLDSNPTDYTFLGVNPEFPEDEELYAPMQYDSLAPFLFEALGQSLGKINGNSIMDKWKYHTNQLRDDPKYALKVYDELVSVESINPDFRGKIERFFGEDLGNVSSEYLSALWVDHIDQLSDDPSYVIQDFMFGLDGFSFLKDSMNNLGFNDEKVGSCFSDDIIFQPWTNYFGSPDGDTLLNKFNEALQTLSAKLLDELKKEL